MIRKLLSVVAAGIFVAGSAQVGYWPNDTKGKDRSVYAVKNITLYQDYKTKVENAVLVFQEGKILASGKVSIPKNAVVIDGHGAFVYPSFIDPYASVGVEKAKRNEYNPGSSYLPTDATSSAYNDAVKADARAVSTFTNQGKDFQEYLNQGFGSVLSFNEDGIVRGSAVLIALGEGISSEKVIKEDAGLMLSLDKGSSRQAYPSSLVGAVALLRQLYLDADWYGKAGNAENKNTNLEAFNRFKKLPTIIETSEKWDVLRADNIGDEAATQFVFVGSGTEYQRVKEMKATNGTFILPLEYPKPYQVQDMMNPEDLDVADLKHWELAPYNAVYLAREKVPFALTMFKLKDKASFLDKLRDLNKKGLSKEEILQSLTQKPAQILQVTSLGNLNQGSLANFIMVSDDLFAKEAVIYENWVSGKQNIINRSPDTDVRGDYRVQLNSQTYDLKIKGKITKPEAEIIQSDKKGKVKLAVADYKMAMELKLPNDSLQNYRIMLPLTDFRNRTGTAMDKDGHSVPFTISFVKAFEPEAKKEDIAKADEPGKIWYPFSAFGAETLPAQKDYLIRNATVWTNSNKGIAKNTDVKVSKGKIVQVGQGLSPGNAAVIDGTNFHLTSGIIDEHTHIGLSRGVNESGTNNSGEVRMSDAIDPDDVNFYRQLAGGVTSAQQLHGSANPVGGQASMVKFRWGEDAENMRFPQAKPYIKFALGENVKQSNWGNSPNRFPQSRGGVEQAFDFWFTRALEYEKEKAVNKNYRKDLRLETMLEILKDKRFITCHSYVQSEINMLMDVADRFDFRVQTFTHILEGYKVADKMKKHGANASTFSDWWAYKEEVREAIPYNAALMMQAGVNVAINSDDAEMARRLNQEAGKTVKYGNVPQEEAWKMVTLNPAKMLQIDHKVGSIEAGKDADLVLWTNNPLSIYATVDKTFVDGILYFDAAQQPLKDKMVKDEKNRIIQKMLFSDDAKKGNTQSTEKKQRTLYHCDTLEGEEHESHSH
ncbi:amidohydrolase family protein [Chryseobacterium gotjawalense]|uniref:Amidohydrolase family protein n=1 Tax=Chryseobacterium gotjawalense TaxID=3042315 RepID=A0ABY8RCW1_9FLAO|nr:amidohydrolase family protein [Chryseobacterium sp. wdc7]WHF51815.1 amidohydrolase family protein [Chryseobacterium sp. wdc7]